MLRYHDLMEVLASYQVGTDRRIELCRGDLASVDPTDASDLLIVSAFPDDYSTTATSLIGQLARRGLSVAELAADKEADLRPTTSCWISKPIDEGRKRFGFDRLLCYEPRVPAQAPETVGDMFRALVPYVGKTAGVRTVAMPIVGAGDMRRPVDEMLQGILEAAFRWMTAGVPLERLRIVTRAGTVERATNAFAAWRERNQPERDSAPVRPKSDQQVDGDVDHPNNIDVFVSYARKDGAATAEKVVRLVRALRPTARVFLDTLSIDIGAAWQQHIASSIEASKRVVVVLTPGFLVSKICQEELNMASLKHLESSDPVLFPIYVLSCERLPLHLRVLNYFECREEDATLIGAACQRLVQSL